MGGTGVLKRAFLWQHSRNYDTFQRVCGSFVCIHRTLIRRGCFRKYTRSRFPLRKHRTHSHHIVGNGPNIHIPHRPEQSPTSSAYLRKNRQKTTPDPHGRVILFAWRCRWNLALSVANSHTPCRPSFSFQTNTALAF